MTRSPSVQITCPINILNRHEAERRRLTRAIYLDHSNQAKAGHAEDLVASASVLIACQQYNEDSLDCCICRNVCGLQRQTATLLLKGVAMQSAGQSRTRRTSSRQS